VSEDESSEKSGTEELLVGTALGVVAAGEAFAGMAVCPVCIIGAPILLGMGAYKKYKDKSR